MELVIKTTKPFKKDFQKQYTPIEQQQILARIEQYGGFFVKDKASFSRHAYQPCPIHLGEWESSLYVMRIGQTLRVLATIDEDPLFDQVIVNLKRIVRTENLERIYRTVATRSIHQTLINP